MTRSRDLAPTTVGVITAALAWLAMSCGGGSQDGPTEPEAPEFQPRVASVEVVPDSASVTAGDTVEFEATVLDQRGDQMSDVSVEWSSSDSSIVTVSENGSAVGQLAGRASVRATANDSVSDSSPVNVLAPPRATTVEISRDSVRLTEDDTTKLDAEVRDQYGDVMSEVAVEWTSTDPDVVSVGDSGTTAAEGVGKATIRATANDTASDSVSVTVAESLLSQNRKALTGDHHPPYLDIAAGPSSLFMVSTVQYARLDKTGRILETGSDQELLSSVIPEDGDAFFPTVMYDRSSDRFFLAAVTRGAVPCEGEECTAQFVIAVSKSSSPGSLPPEGWHIYAFDATVQGDSAVQRYAEFPRIAVGAEAVVLVARALPFDDQSDAAPYTRVRVFEKEAMLRGDSVGWTDLDGVEGPVTDSSQVDMQPVRGDYDQPAPRLVSPAADCRLVLWEVEDPLGTAQLSHTVVSPGGRPSTDTSCKMSPDPTQPDNAPRLGIGISRLPSPPMLRNGSVWLAQQVNIKRHPSLAAVRWTELDVAGGSESAAVIQDTLIRDANDHLFLPAMAVDPGGNVAMIFGRSGDTTYPSLSYALRSADTEAGEFGGRQELVDGTSSLTEEVRGPARHRFVMYGFYFGASVDPVDGSLWMVGEYATGPDTWAARVANVRF